MTTKLYDSSAYETAFDATVLSCTEAQNGFDVVLDRTLFFPEEGGQEADGGALGGRSVKAVRIDGAGVITHTLDGALTVGETVRGEIDFAFRFRNMQNHTAEHILSGITHSLYGYENVGFHLGREEMTLDFNGELSDADLERIEHLANEVVWKNLAVTAEYPPAETLSSLVYRAKLDLTENVRIVTIDGVDACACCAPHVAKTGDIGVIKIRSAIRYKGGMRLTAAAGVDALKDYCEKQNSVVSISRLLSVPEGEVATAVRSLLEANGRLKGEKAAAEREVARATVNALSSTEGNICLFFATRESRVLREAALAAAEKAGGVAVAVGGDAGAYSYVIAAKNAPLSTLVRDYNRDLSGRGGGNDGMVQGSFAATREEIEAYFLR